MTAFSIAPMDPEAPAAAQLIRALSEELARRYAFEDDGAGFFDPNDVRVPRSCFLVAMDGSTPVGCGALRPLSSPIAEVKRMYVCESHRGRGISKLLLSALEDRAGDFGYATVRLETGLLQPEAIALYEKSGYRRIPNYGAYEGNPHSVSFEKALEHSPARSSAPMSTAEPAG